MRLTFLGTGAAEGYPALWCRCERCAVARTRGGRDLRHRSSALLNDDLLLDCGPDLVASAIKLGTDLAPVQALLVTHPHSDHLDPTVLMWRRRGFVTTPLPLMRFYGSARTLERTLSRAEGREANPADFRVEPHTVRPFEPFEVRTGTPATAPAEVDPRFPDSAVPVPRTPPALPGCGPSRPVTPSRRTRPASTSCSRWRVRSSTGATGRSACSTPPTPVPSRTPPGRPWSAWPPRGCVCT